MSYKKIKERIYKERLRFKSEDKNERRIYQKDHNKQLRVKRK